MVGLVHWPTKKWLSGSRDKGGDSFFWLTVQVAGFPHDLLTGRIIFGGVIVTVASIRNINAGSVRYSVYK